MVEDGIFGFFITDEEDGILGPERLSFPTLQVNSQLVLALVGQLVDLF